MARVPLYYLATAGHTNAVDRLVASPQGRRLEGRLRPVRYEDILARMTAEFWLSRTKEAWWEMSGRPWTIGDPDVRRAWRTMLGRAVRLLRPRRAPRRGVYIFTDLEVLLPEMVTRAAALWETLARSGAGLRLVNHPTRTMRRYELLRTLRQHGVNTFDVYRATEGRWPARYPVFLRLENDHAGARTPLLPDRAALEIALNELARLPIRRDEILITEFCDTADRHGIYRKYGAFVVGRNVFPKSVQFGRHWVLKRTQIEDADLLREERAYVETNPHARELQAIFALARVEYGRMDYGLLNGAIQVWEINTNPHITNLSAARYGSRRAVYDLVEQRMAAALEALADEPASGPGRPAPSRPAAGEVFAPSSDSPSLASLPRRRAFTRDGEADL
jgi:hypothetical protein